MKLRKIVWNKSGYVLVKYILFSESLHVLFKGFTFSGTHSMVYAYMEQSVIC